MTWIDIAWPMMGAVSLTLALIHLLIWFHQRTQPAHLMFSLAAGVVAVLAIFELLAMRAQTPEQYALLLRWAHVPVALLAVSLVGFVLLHFRAGRPWLGFAACAIRVICLPANFLSGANLNFETITALNRIEVWGPDVIAVPIGDPNPWMLLAQLSNILLVLFMLDAIVSVRGRGNVDEHRRALLVCGSIALFIVLSSAWTALIVLDRVHGPLTVNVAFFAVVLAMSRELGADVVRAAGITRQLAHSESRLRESEQRMQLAANAAGLGLWTWDIDSDEMWFTDSGGVLLGLAQGEHIRRELVFDRVHPDDRKVITQALDEVLGGGSDFNCEFRLVLPEDRMHWIAAKGRMEHGPADAPRLIRGVIMEVTALRQAEERFRLVIDNAPTAMLMADGDSRIVLANAQAARVFGYGRAELLGLRLDALVPQHPRAGPSEDRVAFVADPQARAVGTGCEVFGHRKDGSKVPIEVGLTPLRIGEDEFVLASVVDISERLRLEQETALQRDELAHLSRVTLLGEMSGSIAHELNQPLTAILSNAQAALRFLQHDPPNLREVHDSLVDIVENDKRASEVIRRLRAMLRKEQVNYQELAINEVVQDVLRLINSDVLNRNVTVLRDLGSALPTIIGDRIQLQQVLLNLILNACDAMGEVSDGRTLTVQTRTVPGPAIEVRISDIGRGIPAEDLERIFAPFVTSKVEGIGLGLAICRTIIEAHRGVLWATNNVSRGATMHFRLPASR